MQWNYLPRRYRNVSEGNWRDIVLEKNCSVRFRRRVIVDLGGIAKGFAVDRAIEALKRAGVSVWSCECRWRPARFWIEIGIRPFAPSGGANAAGRRDQIAGACSGDLRNLFRSEKMSPGGGQLVGRRPHRSTFAQANQRQRSSVHLHDS